MLVSDFSWHSVVRINSSKDRRLALFFFGDRDGRSCGSRDEGRDAKRKPDRRDTALPLVRSREPYNRARRGSFRTRAGSGSHRRIQVATDENNAGETANPRADSIRRPTVAGRFLPQADRRGHARPAEPTERRTV